MAESVDASVSNTDIERCAGSTPAPGTKKRSCSLEQDLFFVLWHHLLHKAGADQVFEGEDFIPLCLGE